MKCWIKNLPDPNIVTCEDILFVISIDTTKSYLHGLGSNSFVVFATTLCLTQGGPICHVFFSDDTIMLTKCGLTKKFCVVLLDGWSEEKHFFNEFRFVTFYSGFV